LNLVLVAAAVLIDTDGRVLIAERPEGRAMAGLWEFPGGKVEPGETPEAALIRELAEELGIGIWARCLAPLTSPRRASMARCGGCGRRSSRVIRCRPRTGRWWRFCATGSERRPTPREFSVTAAAACVNVFKKNE
jgi:hypothetical protein